MNSTVKLRAPERADRQIAIIAFALALAVYLRGVAPDMLGGDPGEFHFAAWRWGLAHPTGYPLYLLLGGLWQRALGIFGISPALALNILSGVVAALVVSLFYLLMRRWLWEVPVLGRLAAVWAAFFLGVNPTFWSQALLAEVYALHALFVISIFWVAQGLALPERESGPVEAAPAIRPRSLALLGLLVGLSLTHHGMTLLLVPGLLIYLTLVDRRWWWNWRNWLAGLAAIGAPLLLYLYVPLRSGPGPSPWYHQRLGDGTLTLYDGSRRAFLDFVTGRSISVGFHDLAGAWDQVGQAATLWMVHFNWAGLVLIVLGLIVLVWRRNWPVLALTAPYFILQQLFNLFYAIGDILVYYIPLYLVALIWAGFGAYGLATGVRPIEEAAESDAKGEADETVMGRWALGAVALVLLFWLPLNQWTAYNEMIDQSNNRAARLRWEEVLAAGPPADAILVSNDRNEIVPLFYLQTVEKRATGMTGIFPLIAPEPRFADIGATVETALREGGEQPVVLIKAMPGLEAKFTLEELTEPLVRVAGLAAEDRKPAVPLDAPYGPLTLVGYDWQVGGEELDVTLYWQVNDALDADYTTTVQLFDGDGEKVAQDDRPPGGDYYPTALWKPGEILLDHHQLTLPEGAEPAILLVGMYTGADFTPLADFLRFEARAIDTTGP